MCAIAGPLLWRATTSHLEEANRILKYIGNASFAQSSGSGSGFHVNGTLGLNFWIIRIQIGSA